VATAAEHTLVAAFLEQMPDLVCFKDRDHRCIGGSQSLARRHGVTQVGDLVGLTDGQLFCAEYAQRSQDEEKAVMTSGQPALKRTVQIPWPDGGVTWSCRSRLPLRDESGAVVGTIGLSEDCTAATETERSLDKAQKELLAASRLAGMAEVATGVLHNVGNVLNSLNISAAILSTTLRQSKLASLTKLTALLESHRGDLEAFLTSDPKGQRVPELLSGLAQHLESERTAVLGEVEMLQKHIDHIKEIVSMQQSYARMAGVVESLAPSDLIEDSLRMNAAALVRHDVQVRRDFEPVPLVRAERGKSLQILINLIRNAKYAIDERADSPRLLTLRVRPGRPGLVRITVEDTGVGIPPEYLTRIFSHGFTTRSSGHGFGLHSSALAASEMQGVLSVASAGRNQGAVFHLDLPEAGS